MWERVAVILRKEFIQALREPRMRALLFGPPLIQLIIFGFAVNLDVDYARIAWMDRDCTPQSRDLRARFEGSGRFGIVELPDSEAEAQRAIDRGAAEAVVRILPGFASDLARGRTAAVQLLVDGTNSNTASLIAGYANVVLAGFAEDTVSRVQMMRSLAGGPAAVSKPVPPGIDVRTRVWFNPDLRSRNYFVPGVVANIIMLVTLMLTALAIVREKEIGTMEQLMVTPVRPLELMLGKTLPFAVIGLAEVALITSAALVVFHVPLRGSVLLLLLSSVLFLMTTLGAGLFLSTVSRTQQQAMLASFFFALPAFMLSGFAFPIRNMPLAVQYLTYLDPLRYFVEIVRGIFLKGVGGSVLWPQLLWLTVYGVAVLALSAARFRKQLD
jgi:drug efflux transport system permease protein